MGRLDPQVVPFLPAWSGRGEFMYDFLLVLAWRKRRQEILVERAEPFHPSDFDLAAVR